MKKKRSLWVIIILLFTIAAIIAFTLVHNVSKKPTITEKEFPFSITYELDGKTETINGVYAASFAGHGGYASTTECLYNGGIVGMPEDSGAEYVISEYEDGSYLVIVTKLYAGYLMGDPTHNYFDNEEYKPQLWYYDAEDNAYDDEEILAAYGVRLVEWEYPQPVENTFVFSHISYVNGEVALPTTAIALVALLVVIIFVKRDKTIGYKPFDIVSVVFSFVIGFVAIPFMALIEALVDITGGSDAVLRQVGYFVPAFSMLCLAVAVWFRRKGLTKSAFVVQLIGPAIFVFTLIASLFGIEV